MNLKAIVTANHNTKQAKLSFVDENGNSPIDNKGNKYSDMIFP